MRQNNAAPVTHHTNKKVSQVGQVGLSLEIAGLLNDQPVTDHKPVGREMVGRIEDQAARFGQTNSQASRVLLEHGPDAGSKRAEPGHFFEVDFGSEAVGKFRISLLITPLPTRRVMTTTQYAQHRNCSDSYVRRLRRAGSLVTTDEGAIDVDASDARLAQAKRESRAEASHQLLTTAKYAAIFGLSCSYVRRMRRRGKLECRDGLIVAPVIAPPAAGRSRD